MSIVRIPDPEALKGRRGTKNSWVAVERALEMMPDFSLEKVGGRWHLTYDGSPWHASKPNMYSVLGHLADTVLRCEDPGVFEAFRQAVKYTAPVKTTWVPSEKSYVPAGAWWEARAIEQLTLYEEER